LLAPADGQEFAGSGETITLDWQPVAMLGEDEWYEIRLSYVNKNGETVDEVVAWAKNEDIAWPLDPAYFDALSLDERGIGWEITIVWDPDGDGLGQPVSPPSEIWVFDWR